MNDLRAQEIEIARERRKNVYVSFTSINICVSRARLIAYLG